VVRSGKQNRQNDTEVPKIHNPRKVMVVFAIGAQPARRNPLGILDKKGVRGGDPRRKPGGARTDRRIVLWRGRKDDDGT